MISPFASRLGIEHPLIQAPMSGSTPPALVAAVSNAGGLGSLGAGYLEPQAILDQATQIRALGDKPHAINLFVLPDEFNVDMAAVAKAREQLDALMAQEGLDVRTACRHAGRRVSPTSSLPCARRVRRWQVLRLAWSVRRSCASCINATST
jgi:Dioxygenases related to 2-nitropropane dioxygenase